MGSIKINSISIDLAAANETDAGKCDHFSLRGFVAEIRERDHRKCWPFSEDSVELGNHQRYTLPPLSVLKSRWWRCPSCIKDINNGKEINDIDCQLQSHLRSVKEKTFDFGSSDIPSKRTLNPVTVIDKKEKNNDVQTGTSLKKVRRRAKDGSTVKSKSSKLASTEQVSKKSKEMANISSDISWKESREAVNGSYEIAGVVYDTPTKAIKKKHRSTHAAMEWDECDNVSPQSRHPVNHNTEGMTGLHRRKSRKIRLLSELLSDRNKETLSKKESVRGRKRKSSGDEDCRTPEVTNYASRVLSTVGKTSENASKSCDSEDNNVSGAESGPIVESQSTDSGFDKDPIKGKQRNKRFQVVDERFPETSQKDTSDYTSPVHSTLPTKELVPRPLHIQRTEKEFSLVKKRKRKTDKKKSTVITFSNNADDGNLIKLRKPDHFSQDGPRNVMPQSTRDFLNSNWLDRSCDKFSESDGQINNHTPQRDDRPVFPLPLQDKLLYKDDDRAMLKGIGTNHFRYFGSSFKPTNADGCLRTGVNVDFNSKRYNSGPSSLNGNLRQTSTAEDADTFGALQKDIYPAHGKGKEVVVQELSGAPRIQSNASEHIDDIPMEIVELMAKNQYERCLPDIEEDQQPSQATTSVSKNALLIDLNETYDNSMDNILRQPKPLGNNAMNSDGAAMQGHLMTGKQRSLEFFQTNQFGQLYNVPSGFGISPGTLDNQSSSIQFSGVVGPSQQSSHNCQWLGNVPTTMSSHPNPFPSSFRVLRACKTCQSVQQQQNKEASHPIWPSSMTPSHAHRAVTLNMPQKFPDQSTKLDNPNTRNLSFDNGRQKPEGVSSKSLDTYSNESSIPALHLLSLMDPRLRSNIPIDQSQNTKFVKGPFSSVHQSKEFIGPQPMDCNKKAYSTKQWPFDFSEPSRANFSISPVGTSSIAFQGGNSSAENANSTFQPSWIHHQEKKSKRKDNNFVPSYNNGHHQKPSFTSTGSDPGKFQLLGASDSMMLPLKFHMTDNAKKHKTKKAQNNNAVSAWPPKNSFGPVICIVNRNPADFTIPDAPGNIYMTKGEDLKVKRPAGFRKKPSLCKQDVLKQNEKSMAPTAENT
ncbi:embryonic flower 1 [Arabis alpina]|uniref:Embryonic flower 1 n=1 Tax=Arabis alpina TaxID=50452 RepID=A0A087GD72_ARAAL|nr:embryonic flower 1 [Arabis alpina]